MRLLFILIFAFSCSSTKKEEPKVSKRFSSLKREAEVGKRISVRLLKAYPRHDDEGAQTYISSLGRSIVHRMGRQELYYYFAIVKSNQAKSFAAPSGFVFVTTGLIKSMKTEAQLVGVLSREIANVNGKYLLNALKKEKDLLKAADMGWEILRKNQMNKKDVLKSEQEAVLGMMTMSYDPKQYIGVAKNKKYVRKIVGKMNAKVSQSNQSRFRKLKTRI